MKLFSSTLILTFSLWTCVSADVLRFPIQPTATAYLKKRDTNGAPLYNANGKEYLVQVGVGTPPQLFNLTLDTGR